MRKIVAISVCLLLISVVCLPAVAQAHRYGGHGGGHVFWGFGAGLLTGYLFAPRTVVVPPPVRVAPPPVYHAVPAPAPPPLYSYSDIPPQPGNHAKCREWRLLERRYQDSWDSYSGTWRSVPVEKWGWVEVPCGN